MLQQVRDAVIRLETAVLGVPGQSGGALADIEALKKEQRSERDFRVRALALIAFLAFLVEPVVLWATSVFSSGGKKP